MKAFARLFLFCCVALLVFTSAVGADSKWPALESGLTEQAHRIRLATH